MTPAHIPSQRECEGLNDSLLDAPVNILAENCFPEDSLGAIIADAYGKEAFSIFLWAQAFTSIYLLADLFGAFGLVQVPTHRRKLIKEQRDLAMEFLKAWGEIIVHDLSSIVRGFGLEIASSSEVLAERVKRSKPSPLQFVEVRKLVEPIVNALVPGYKTLDERLDRAKELRMQLRKCPPGRENWREYEEICLKILRFAFVPPFQQVMTQVRNVDGHERRDAILPNNRYEGFWAALRSEFQTRHIVCEFKNIGSRLGKTGLHQLRIYLSKPTIGRFGLMFVRESPSESLKKAQRDAYEQSKILILILDDQKVDDLLYARCFLGNAEEVLEREKILFEVNY